MSAACPACAQPNIYPDDDKMVCADCGHEWSASAPDGAASADGPGEDGERVVRDANGNVLADGDSVVLIKSLKVSGSVTLKQGTKVSNIKLIDGDHEIDCKVDKMGVYLKAQFVRKV